MKIQELAQKAQKRIDANRGRMNEESEKVRELLEGQGLPLYTRLRCDTAAKEFLSNEIKNLEIFLAILFDLTADEDPAARAEVEE